MRRAAARASTAGPAASPPGRAARAGTRLAATGVWHARNSPCCIALALALAVAPGCFRAPELSGVRRDIQSQLPGASFDKNVELSFGPAGLALVRLVTAVIPGAREARPYLRDVSRVQIGVYDAHIASARAFETPKRLQVLIDEGWETAIRVRDDDEAAWLLYRADGETIREVFIVVLNREELVLVRAKGRLERLIAAALDRTPGTRRFTGELYGS